jgi:lipid-A-disaccharide synthase
MTSLFVFAGDVSADRHTAKLLEELKRYVPNLSVWGCGGSCMRAQGMEILHDSEKFGVFGVVEVLRSIPFFARLRKELVSAVAQRKPDAVLLVDFGGFNLQLVKQLRRQNKDLPIIYFISPQIWGSRSWRIKIIAKTISKMLVIFPFEETLYKNAGVDAAFVGHPLAAKSDDIEHSKEQWCQALGLDPSRPIIGIMPGSRRREIKDHMPVILQSIKWLHRLAPEIQFVVSQANEAISQEIQKRFGQKLLQLKNKGNISVAPVGGNQPVMAYSDLLWVKSGTSTLEAALAAKPMLIFYRADWLSYLVFLMFKRVKHVGLPNLLAGKQLAPELMQLDCSAEQFVRHSLDFLDAPGLRAEITQELTKIKSTLGGPNFPKAAAQQICKTLGLATELSSTLSKIPT